MFSIETGESPALEAVDKATPLLTTLIPYRQEISGLIHSSIRPGTDKVLL